MKKVILVPDSFKGTLSSEQICEIMRERIEAHHPNAEIVSIPVADGGEGSVACFLGAMGGELIKCRAVNPFFEEMEGFYGLVRGGKTAVIEMAACAGLPLVENRKDPMKATTYGVGLLIEDALSQGVEEIVLGLGGSATNDFGCGAAAALGVIFRDANGESFIPTGGTLYAVEHIDVSGVPSRLKDVKITLMCDVKNPVWGENGAAFVYAPQKGANAEQVLLLDAGLRHICDVVRRALGKDVSRVIGGGAAGAMAGGMIAFFDAKTRMGIDVVLDTVGFDRLLEGADMVFTGEGKIDSQSLEGKVVIGVARRAKEKGVPVVAVVGGAEGDLSVAYDMGVTAVFPINRLPEDFSVSRYKSEENLRHTVDNILRLCQ
ncbi:MAG: glycerate kinase [Clostridia bacterium]|nr:glycerate kinase [Clostridia bacterium]